MQCLVLSNVNMDPIKPFLPGLDCEFGQFKDYLIQLSDNAARAHADDIELVILHLDGDELVGTPSSDEWRECIKYLDLFCNQNPEKIIAINTIVTNPLHPSSFHAVISEDSPGIISEKINFALREIALRNRNVALLDVKAICLKLGWDNVVAQNFWYLGRIKYTQRMFRELGVRYTQLLEAFRFRSKKVLVLDLDNTLWGGVIGEEGVAGIDLSEEGRGKCFRDFQKLVKSLSELGVLLAISSKNNFADVEEVFQEHPMMVIRLDDFAAVRVNWDSKAENIEAIAEELNIGLNSMVFIDDSPHERAIVRESLTEVIVPDVPSQAEDYCRWFVEHVCYAWFPKYRIANEDKSKVEQYRRNASREKLRRTIDGKQFIEGLDIRLNYYLDDLRYVDRASQLTQKTNQFNLTTKRYSTSQIEGFMRGGEHAVVLVDYEDRFGKEGIVGLSIANLADGSIDSFLMSCRVIGRGVEGKLLAFIESQVREHGKSMIRGEFRPTKKNVLASGFFQAHGFSKNCIRGDGAVVFEKRL